MIWLRVTSTCACHWMGCLGCCTPIFAKAGSSLFAGRRGDDETNDEAIEAQSLCKDEDEDHAHKELWVACIRPHTRVADNANGKTGGQRTQANHQPRSQMRIARIGRVLADRLDVPVDDY